MSRLCTLRRFSVWLDYFPVPISIPVSISRMVRFSVVSIYTFACFVLWLKIVRRWVVWSYRAARLDSLIGSLDWLSRSVVQHFHHVNQPAGRLLSPRRRAPEPAHRQEAAGCSGHAEDARWGTEAAARGRSGPNTSRHAGVRGRA